MSTAQASASAEAVSAAPAPDAGAKSTDNDSSTLEGLRRDLRESESSLAQASTTLARAQKKVEDLQKEISEIESIATSYAELHPALAKDLKEIDDFVRCKLDALQRDGQTPSDAQAIEKIVADASSAIAKKRKAADDLREVILAKGAKEDRAVAEAELELTLLKETQTRVESELAGCKAVRTRIESPEAETRERYALLIELRRRVERLKVYGSETAKDLQPAPDKLQAKLVTAAKKLNEATKDQRDEHDKLEKNRRLLEQGENDLATQIEDLVEHILSQVRDRAAVTAQAG